MGGRYSVDSAVGTVLAVTIGPENFADLDALTPDLLKSMIDRVAAAPISPEEQEAAVRKLRQTEQVNVETARRLLGV